MKNADLITPTEAVEFAKSSYNISVTKQTIMAWLDKYKGLGRKVVGRWYIDRHRFKILLEGKTWKDIKEVEE